MKQSGIGTLRRSVETWIFDLDNTLYPASARLFDQINLRMTAFIAEALAVEHAHADRLRRDLWSRHGTTMAGLAAEHGVAPEAFLEASHQIDLGGLAPDTALARAIDDLPGRKIVHTNGPRMHARRVLAARGLEACFEMVITIEDTGLVSKPRRAAFDRAADLAGHDPARAAMIEDHVENLVIPREMGMETVWIEPGRPSGTPDHVDHHIEDLTAFLTGA